MNDLNKSLYGISDSDTEYITLNRDEISSRWDKKSEFWDQHLLNENCHLNQDNAYSNFIVEADLLLEKYFCPNTEMHLLEVGCGTGLVAQALQRSDLLITGIDISTKMVEKAQSKNIKNARFLVVDIFQLSHSDIPPANFIFSRGILLSHYGYTNGELILKNLYEKCILNKSIVMLDFLSSYANASSLHLPQNKTYYTREKIIEMVKKIGFKKYSFIGSIDDRVNYVVLRS